MNVSFHADLDPDPMAIVTNHLNDDDDLNGGGINPSQQEQNVATTSKVPTLKRLCEIALAKAVNTSTLVDTLAYSEALDARALTRYCVSFMRMNLDAVLLSITHNPIDIEVLRYQTSAGLIGVVPEDLDNMFAFVDAEDEVAAELRDSKIAIEKEIRVSIQNNKKLLPVATHRAVLTAAKPPTCGRVRMVMKRARALRKKLGQIALWSTNC